MNFDTIIELVSKNNNEVTSDVYGNPVYLPSRRKIFAEKIAIKQSEFFQAAAVGFKPEIVLEVNSFEYENEEECYLDGQLFKIYRVYPIKNRERTELYLTSIVGETNVIA
jgi:hypothetical protein